MLSYVENYGPIDDKGQRASGVTHYTARLDWRSNGNQRACAIATMTIYVDIQVLLPALDATSNAPAGVRAKWSEFASGVAIHEQRHVDIYVAGAESTKERMLAIQPATGCSALEAQVNNVWDSQQGSTDAEQEQFHADERRRIEALRAPLRRQIDARQKELDALTAQIRAIESTLRDLSSQISPLRDVLASLTAQMEGIESRYLGQPLPADVHRQYETLRGQYNNLIPSYNALVDQYNKQAAQHTELARQAQFIQADINNLVDSYNWTR